MSCRDCTFKTAKEFVGEVLPEMIKGRSSLRVLLSTYNSVKGYGDGEHRVGDDLTFSVHCGGVPAFSYSTAEKLAAMVGGKDDPEVFDQAKKFLVGLSRGAQHSVEDRSFAALDSGGTEKPDLLAVVYAGVTAFPEALDFAVQLAEFRPGAKVVLLTCDCQHDRKLRVLEPLLERGIISCVIETEQCGGSRVMGELADAIRDEWARVRAAGR